MVSKRQKLHTKSHKKPYLPLLIILLLAAVFGATFGVLYLVNHSNSNSSNNAESSSQSSSNSTNDTNKSSSSSKDAQSSKDASENSNTAGDATEEENDKKPTEYEGENANRYANLTGYISNSHIDNSVLSVNVIVDQTTSGTCSFVVTSPSGKVYNSSASIDVIGTSGGCFSDIPLSSVESGTYKITVELTGSNRTGKITGELPI